ncbi:MAG: hypothetical protein NC898_06255 [Candidatus Omnitrophica bacterium]|nr:hypothetical protein [Candidatus Omnitrophota bacterium]MCM8794043.1 hypothetical protein [Candidatus Omnitrophota bacterium]
MRNIKQVQFTLERILAEEYVKKNILTGIFTELGRFIPEDRLEKILAEISIDRDKLRAVIGEKLEKKEINVVTVIEMVNMVIEQLRNKGETIPYFKPEEKMRIVENVVSALFEVQEITLDKEQRYIFYVYVEEKKEEIIPAHFLTETPRSWEEKLDFYVRFYAWYYENYYGEERRAEETRSLMERNKSGRYYFLEKADPRVVVVNLVKLQRFFDSVSSERIKVLEYPILSARNAEYVINRAKAIDRLVKEKGLRVGYRYGEGIEITDPEILTISAKNIEDNLELLNFNGLTFERFQTDSRLGLYRELLYLSHFKLLTNLRFLKHLIEREGAVIDIFKNAYLLKQIFWRLQNNYMVLKILGAKITPARLNYTEGEMFDNLKKGTIETQGFSPEQVEKLINNLKTMLGGQGEFINWYTQEDIPPEEKERRKDFYTQRAEANIIFDNKGYKELNIPKYSLFSLMTYIYLTNRLGMAVMDFAGIILKDPKNLSLDLGKDLRRKYALDDDDTAKLNMVIGLEISKQK